MTGAGAVIATAGAYAPLAGPRDGLQQPLSGWEPGSATCVIQTRAISTLITQNG
jgi:hypothetical protein